MIQLSKAALKEVLRLKSKQPHPDLVCRLGVQPGGCCEFTYTMGFDQTIHPDDQILETDQLRVIVDAQSLNYINGLTLDYSEDLMGGGFRFHNPNAVQHCGCGNSFSVTQTSQE